MSFEKERLTISLDSKKIAYVDSCAKKHKLMRLKKGESQADRSKTINLIIKEHKELPTLKARIKELENNGFENKDTNLNGGQALSQPTTETPFDYQNWYSDCGYGTYFKAKKKVHCRCTYPSVKKWLPRNRMVEPQVCDNCFPRIQEIQGFINTQREEKQALSHTSKYFTNEYGQRIPY